MGNTVRKILVFQAFVVVLLLGNINAVYAQGLKISDTKYDYSAVAGQITRGCISKSEQAEAIYRWICKNIAYDTEHKIHTADECWDNRKGVCQAYCELFYRLSEPLGLGCHIIQGVSKDADGVISDKGHAWLYIELDDEGILADPTWGAGGVEDGEFIRSEDPMLWFRVDPSWLIFTHYPDNAEYQFVGGDTIDIETFAALPPLKPSLGVYGFSSEELMLQYAEGEELLLPHVYSAHCKDLYLKDIPLLPALRPGHYYTFKIAKRTERGMVLVHGDDYVYEQEWEMEDSCHVLRYMPTSAGMLYIALARDEGDYSAAVEYEVAEPSAEELDTIERLYPYKMPEMKIVENLYPEKLQAIGISGAEILREVRKGRLSSMLTLYKDAENRLEDVEIPLSQFMQVGQRYILAIKPVEEGDWAVFLNGELYDMFVPDKTTGWYMIELTPTLKGVLSVNMKSSDSGYHRVLGYTVR